MQGRYNAKRVIEAAITSKRMANVRKWLRWLRSLGALAAAAALAVPSLAAPAANRNGADPGTAFPAFARQAILEQDLRLHKPVTLRLKRSPLAVVAAQLGRQAGVAMTASPEVADEPAIVFVTEQPAKEVMHHLASLFNYRWTRKGTAGRFAYEIYQDLQSKQEEEALHRQRYQRALQSLQVALRRCLQLAQRPIELLRQEAAVHDAAIQQFEQIPELQRLAAQQTPEHRALVSRAAWSYELHQGADPLQRALLRLAGSLTSAQWNALMDGATLHFSTRAEWGRLSSLPADGTGQARQPAPLPPSLAAELRAAQPLGAVRGAQLFFATAEEEASHHRFVLQATDDWARAEGYRISARLELPSRPGTSSAILTLRPAAVGSAGALPSLPGLIVVGHGAPVAAEAAGEQPAADVASWAADPILGLKRRFRLELPSAAAVGEEFGWLNHLLPAIAQTFGINLVADAYRAQRHSLPELPAGEERALYEVLQRYVSPNAHWSKEGAFLRLRRHTWYDDRLAEIPERVVKRWAARFRQAPACSLDDAARLVLELRDEQLAGFEAVMREAGMGVSLPFAGADAESRQQGAILRAYGCLLPGQRQTLQAGGSVASTAMPPPARRWLHTALRPEQSSEGPGPLPGALSLSIPHEAEDEAVQRIVPISVQTAAAAGLRPSQVQFHYRTGAEQETRIPVILPRLKREPSVATGDAAIDAP